MSLVGNVKSVQIAEENVKATRGRPCCTEEGTINVIHDVAMFCCNLCVCVCVCVCICEHVRACARACV